MKKIIFVFVVVFLILILGNNIVLADETDNSPLPETDHVSGGSGELQNPLGGDFEEVIARVISYVLGLTGVFALIAFIYGGFVWMTSGGDSAKVTKGKNIMMWAVFGLVIIFSSYAILTTIFDALLPARAGADGFAGIVIGESPWD